MFDLLNDKKYKSGVGLERGRMVIFRFPVYSIFFFRGNPNCLISHRIHKKDLSYAMIESIEDAFEYLIIGLKVKLNLQIIRLAVISKKRIDL